MILSGHDLTTISPERLTMLRRLEPPTGVAARFEDSTLEIGNVELNDRRFVCLLNWQEDPRKLSVTLARPARVRDVWTGEDLGRVETQVSVPVGGRDGRLLECSAV
jgi:alpha-galactosidase